MKQCVDVLLAMLVAFFLLLLLLYLAAPLLISITRNIQ